MKPSAVRDDPTMRLECALEIGETSAVVSSGALNPVVGCAVAGDSDVFVGEMVGKAEGEVEVEKVVIVGETLVGASEGALVGAIVGVFVGTEVVGAFVGDVEVESFPFLPPSVRLFIIYLLLLIDRIIRDL